MYHAQHLNQPQGPLGPFTQPAVHVHPVHAPAPPVADPGPVAHWQHSRPHKQIEPGVFEFKVYIHREQSVKEVTMTTNTDFDKLLQSVQDYLGAEAPGTGNLRFGYRISGASRKPIALGSAADWASLRETIKEIAMRARTRAVAIDILNLDPAPSAAAKATNTKKRTRADDVPPSVDATLNKALQNLKATLWCETHSSHCYVTPSATHKRCDYCELSLWAKQIRPMYTTRRIVSTSSVLTRSLVVDVCHLSASPMFTFTSTHCPKLRRLLLLSLVVIPPRVSHLLSLQLLECRHHRSPRPRPHLRRNHRFQKSLVLFRRFQALTIPPWTNYFSSSIRNTPMTDILTFRVLSILFSSATSTTPPWFQRLRSTLSHVSTHTRSSPSSMPNSFCGKSIPRLLGRASQCQVLALGKARPALHPMTFRAQARWWQRWKCWRLVTARKQISKKLT
ncbi:hypothetical protein DENSPDRAFT_189284 [Dentipellis sp. KUC8613]|nr:hypothetical protein DENSPDRAFT_189284 [Dentipellis sp. KUC8613]